MVVEIKTGYYILNKSLSTFELDIHRQSVGLSYCSPLILSLLHSPTLVILNIFSGMEKV